ncbi:hypothetical protein GGX14DRAFT_90042 [Mycena pura]|uniref:SWIM-type domain-containing protein n=1 Tax=Mycena pura TaxID=153505 RepID=A0AAD6VG35_9AGAR|nr:hypothetical protein GGX14DRAFT_90042 [Mycena pura]
MHVEDGYRPNVENWVCSCPAFVVSRFLICKHLIQLCHRVPMTFFREVQRNRTAPFWKHPDLIPLTREVPDQPDHSAAVAVAMEDLRPICNEEVPDDEDEEFEEEDTAWAANAAAFTENLQRRITQLKEFTAALEYQAQFKEHRMLETLERQGAGLSRLADEVSAKEKNANLPRGPRANTWGKGNTMFFHPRPPRRDENIAE